MRLRAAHIMFSLFLLHAGARASDVELGFESRDYTVGEPIGVSLEVRREQGQQIIWPEMGDLEVGLELLAESSDTSGQSIYRELTFMRFDTGEFVFPPLQLQFVSGQDTQVYETAASPYRVVAYPVDTTADIRPLKDRLDVSYRKPPVLLIAIAVLLLVAGLVYWLYLRLSRKPMSAEPEPFRPAPLKPIDEHALERLDALEAKKLWQSERIKEYYIELTDIVREYIEYRFEVPALESTTGGLGLFLERVEIPEEESDRVLSILRAGDLVKFAKARPLPDQHSAAMRNSRDFILNTRPVPETDPETGTAEQ